nr:hypothetical protein [Micromonospora sp. DSM 115978]
MGERPRNDTVLDQGPFGVHVRVYEPGTDDATVGQIEDLRVGFFREAGADRDDRLTVDQDVRAEGLAADAVRYRSAAQ